MTKRRFAIAVAMLLTFGTVALGITTPAYATQQVRHYAQAPASISIAEPCADGSPSGTCKGEYSSPGEIKLNDADGACFYINSVSSTGSNKLVYIRVEQAHQDGTDPGWSAWHAFSPGWGIPNPGRLAISCGIVVGNQTWVEVEQVDYGVTLFGSNNWCTNVLATGPSSEFCTVAWEQ